MFTGHFVRVVDLSCDARRRDEDGGVVGVLKDVGGVGFSVGS